MTTNINSQRLERITRKLRDQGQRVTPQRLAILKALASSKAHPSVEQVYRDLRPEYPTMSLATVYKTIETLKALGEVRELTFHDGSSRYDGRLPREHTHVVCTGCGRIEDLEVDPAPQRRYAARASEETGFRITGQRLDIYGLCPACQRQTTR